MDPQAAKMIGAGIACIGMGGAGVGVGTIFGHYLAAALRNPKWGVWLGRKCCLPASSAT